MQLGVCTDAGIGTPDSWLFDDNNERSITDEELSQILNDGKERDAKRQEHLSRYAKEGTWPNTQTTYISNNEEDDDGARQTPIVDTRQRLNSDDSLNSSSPSRSSTPLLKLGLGDIHAPTPLERRATLILDIDR